MVFVLINTNKALSLVLDNAHNHNTNTGYVMCKQRDTAIDLLVDMNASFAAYNALGALTPHYRPTQVHYFFMPLS